MRKIPLSLMLFLTLTTVSSCAMESLPFFKNSNVGKPVVDFTLPSLDGKEINLNQYRDGQKTIIFFWTTWCPNCHATMTRLNDQRDDLNKKQIKLLLVNFGERAQKIRAYVEKNRLGLDMIMDRDSRLVKPYGIIGVPTLFFIDENGIVRDVQNYFPENYEEIFLKR